MLYIFPDTNIFIHAKHFEEINWVEVTGWREITIMLGPSVIGELDKHKYNPVKKVSQRARKLLPRIEDILKDPGSCKWNVAAIVKRPSPSLLDLYYLDAKDQDDLLLATVIEFSSGLGNNDQVVILTNDTGPRLKATSLEVSTILLPVEYMAPPQEDDAEKKIIALQKELDHLRNRTPVVALFFNNHTNYLAVEKPFEIITKEKYVAKEMANIKNEFPPMVFTEQTTNNLTIEEVLRIRMLNFMEPQVSDYNNELEKFLLHYENYFVSEYDQVTFLYNCCRVSLVIKNTGSVPAEDLDILLHFPDGFHVIVEDDIPDVEKKPTPPYRPKHAYDRHMPMFQLRELSSLIPQTHAMPNMPKINANVSSPDIKKTNSYDVKVHVRTVKHNQSAELDTLWLKFDDMRLAKGFTINYQIMAANIPQVVTGQLNVNFVKG